VRGLFLIACCLRSRLCDVLCEGQVECRAVLATQHERVREGVNSVFWECVAFFWSHVVCAAACNVLCEGLSCEGQVECRAVLATMKEYVRV